MSMSGRRLSRTWFIFTANIEKASVTYGTAEFPAPSCRSPCQGRPTRLLWVDLRCRARYKQENRNIH